MSKKLIFKDISVLIPVHELNDTTQALFEAAVNSILTQDIQPKNIVVVCPKGLGSKISNKKLTILEHSEETDFCSQVNYGAKNIDTKFFSILELDDEFTATYFFNVQQYLESYGDVDTLLPIVAQLDTHGNFMGYTNNAVWAQGFSEKLGQLDLASVLNFDSFMTSGGVFRTEKFLEDGGFKGNIKLHFMYEFILRHLHNDAKVLNIPKVLYKHINYREDSLFALYRDPIKGISVDEAKFYLDVAKKEYFFNPNDIKREILFAPKSK